ncbi:DUF2267 domain-containing protein [Streptomyces sp. A7024]|uniref:DUF2267 domain-containing protein n=1 Tax=Streptomyces coryli TaxID=1128680 RepID=A0A6G4U0A5_9ACTN|nr:DUF2267 domain-containing protein [Streptomyces coryli]NGN65513.1 DUF2267 domain-containing protein [Streptomyces coryli]
MSHDLVLARPEPKSKTPISYPRMLRRVQYDGLYPTPERAEETVRLVLTALGRQLTGDERIELAALLPPEAAQIFTAQTPAAEKLTARGFVNELATHTGGSPATARWDAGTVLALIDQLADPDLLTRILTQLPPGFALLFGKAELARAA